MPFGPSGPAAEFDLGTTGGTGVFREVSGFVHVRTINDTDSEDTFHLDVER